MHLLELVNSVARKDLVSDHCGPPAVRTVERPLGAIDGLSPIDLMQDEKIGRHRDVPRVLIRWIGRSVDHLVESLGDGGQVGARSKTC